MIPNLSLHLENLACPMPLLKTKKALATLAAGETVEVYATDAGVPQDFALFCQKTGHQLLSLDTLESGVFYVLIQKKSD